MVEFTEYLESLDANLSDVKRKMLGILWEAGDAFPRSWIRSSHLLEATGQKYFDRRLRELRDEVGCDIEVGHHEGEAAYRLRSPNLGNANPRDYLSQKDKETLFERDEHTCRICGKTVPKGEKGLQADHRIPLIRAERRHGLENWQTLCTECNVAKRRICKGCVDDCGSCAWAFPESSGRLALARLPEQVYRELQEQGFTSARELETAILKALQKYLAR